MLFWWIGAGVVSAVGFLGAAALIAGLHALAGIYCTWKLGQIAVAARNLGDVVDWVKNGRPQWRWHGRVASMDATQDGFGRRTAYEGALEIELRRRTTRRWVRLVSLGLNACLLAYLAWSTLV